uniref:Uncharacterized protein n=1 Tax=Rhizophora mucronata TaxID=61149 RepID=A0A2P2Q038_RHIMU
MQHFSMKKKPKFRPKNQCTRFNSVQIFCDSRF